MSLHTIYSVNLKEENYRPVILYGEPVAFRANQIKKLLRERLGPNFDGLLATPILSTEALIGQTKAYWQTEALGQTAIPFPNLDQQRQASVKKELAVMFQKIHELAQEIRKTQDADLSDLLTFALEIPNASCIYIIDNQIVLVLWGFAREKVSGESFRLSKFVKGVPAATPVTPELAVQEKPTPPAHASLPQEQRLTPPSPSPAPSEVTPPPIQTMKAQSQQPSSQPEENTAEPLEKRKRNWWKWLVYFLLFLLLLLLLLLFARGCKSNPLQPFLPPDSDRDTQQEQNPGAQPDPVPGIDTSRIVVNPEDPLHRPIVGNRLNVYLAKGSDINRFEDRFKKVFPGKGYKILYHTEVYNRVIIEIPEDQREAVKDRLNREFGEVKFVLDETVFKQQQQSANDPAFRDPRKSWAFDLIGIPDAWEITKGSKDIIIAIIDNGFDLNHPELQGRVVLPWNVFSGNNEVNTGTVGLDHGTHVACVAAGNLNNLNGLSGVAPDCGLMTIQVGDNYGNMPLSAIVDGIVFAITQGADIINLSLGSIIPERIKQLSQADQEAFANKELKDQESFWDDLFNYAREQNVLVVQAAGNDNILTGIDPMMRNNYTIKVAATDERDRKADFSNHGGLCQLSAPGNNIYAALPNRSHDFRSGTSSAAPIVSGGLALIKSVNPDLAPEDYLRILIDNGVNVGTDIGPRIQLGASVNETGAYDNACSEEVERLREELSRLRRQLGYKDTTSLVIPENPKNLGFTYGFWKSTTDLFNTKDSTPVELFFEFDGSGRGKLTLVEENGTRCYSNLRVELNGSELHMEQSAPSQCDNGEQYVAYQFNCVSRDGRAAECECRPASANLRQLPVVNFRLIRVQPQQ